MSSEGSALKNALQKRADIAECCKRPGTLICVEKTAPGSALYVCTVCGRRHRYMKAEPGMIGLRGSSLGK